MADIYRGSISMIDRLAPGGLFLGLDKFQYSEGQWGRIWFIADFPPTMAETYLSDLINFPGNVRFTLHVRPLDTRLIHQPLRQEYTQLTAEELARQRQGRIPDFAREAQRQQVEDVLYRLEVERMPYYHVTSVYCLMAGSLEELEKKSKAVEDLFLDAGLIAYRAVAIQERGMHTLLPYGVDLVGKPRNLDAEVLAQMVLASFHSPQYIAPKGIFYGVSRANGTVVVLDDFQQANYNLLVVGLQGMGKSMLLKYKIEQAVLQGIRCFVVDIEGEFRAVCDDLGCVYLDMAVTGENKMNVLDIDPTSEETFLEGFDDFVGWLTVASGALSPRERTVVDMSYQKTLARAGIRREDPSSWKRQPPTLGDWYEVLTADEEIKSRAEARDLADKIYSYAKGMHAEAFNCRTNVDLKASPLVVFGLKDVRDNLKPARIRQIQNFLWANILRDLKPTMIFIDEAWHLMAKPETAEDLAALARRGRKKWAGLNIATQWAEDFLANPSAKMILDTAAMIVLLGQRASSLPALQEFFHLSNAEAQDLVVMYPGQALLITRSFRVPIYIPIPQERYPLYTTKPEEVARLQ